MSNRNRWPYKGFIWIAAGVLPWVAIAAMVYFAL